ncbi:MAG: hypothetical protein ACHP6I_03215 [Rickettsiales bacterium]
MPLSEKQYNILAERLRIDCRAVVNQLVDDLRLNVYETKLEFKRSVDTAVISLAGKFFTLASSTRVFADAAHDHSHSNLLEKNLETILVQTSCDEPGDAKDTALYGFVMKLRNDFEAKNLSQINIELQNVTAMDIKTSKLTTTFTQLIHACEQEFGHRRESNLNEAGFAQKFLLEKIDELLPVAK